LSTGSNGAGAPATVDHKLLQYIASQHGHGNSPARAATPDVDANAAPCRSQLAPDWKFAMVWHGAWTLQSVLPVCARVLHRKNSCRAGRGQTHRRRPAKTARFARRHGHGI